MFILCHICYLLEILILFFCGIILFVKHPILNLLSLILAFISFALMLLHLGLLFMSIGYVILYVGAISVLILFILLLIKLRTLIFNKDMPWYTEFEILIFVGIFLGVLFENNKSFSTMLLELDYITLSYGLDISELIRIGIGIYYHSGVAFILVINLLLLGIVVSISMALCLSTIPNNNQITNKVYKEFFQEKKEKKNSLKVKNPTKEENLSKKRIKCY